MSIKDVTEEPKLIAEGKYLEDIFDLQMFVVDKYVAIEGLPNYPVNINKKENQKVLRDFSDRVIEELAEAFDEYAMVAEITEANQLWFNHGCKDKAYEAMVERLVNFNEEQGDALHFVIELLLFANVSPEDIQGWIVKHAEKWGVSLESINANTEDILHNAIQYGGFGYRDDLDFGTKGTNLLQFATPQDCSCIGGGMFYHQVSLDISSILLWRITHGFKMANNLLKKKPWKQTEVGTDELAYQYKVVESFIKLMGYYWFMGFDSSSLHRTYFKKNCIVKERILNKY